MNAKFYLFLLILMPLLGSSCAGKNVLVQNQVATQYVTGTQEDVWKEKDARKKVPLKSLRVLVVDNTNIMNRRPYERPFHLRMHTEHPVHADTLVESTYYNQQTLAAFKEKLPLKAKVQVLTGKVSEEVLDSLIQTDKYDVVLTAQQICFEYHYNFTGINESGRNRDIGGGVTVGSTTYRMGGIHTPIRHAGTLRSSMAGPAFDFSSGNRRPPLFINAIIFHTDWDLQWITPTGNRKENTVTHLTQEGGTINYSDHIDEVLTSVAQEAGQSLAQVFAW